MCAGARTERSDLRGTLEDRSFRAYLAEKGQCAASVFYMTRSTKKTKEIKHEVARGCAVNDVDGLFFDVGDPLVCVR